MKLLLLFISGIPGDGEGKDWQPRVDRGASSLVLGDVISTMLY